MDAGRVEALAARMGRLEQEVRWWRRAGGSAAALVAIAGLLGMAAPAGGPAAEEVRARRIVLVDAEGRERAALAVDADGWAGLRAVDVAGKTRVALGSAAAGTAALALTDMREKTRVSLAVNTDGLSMLSLLDARGRNKATLGANPAGEAGLRFAKPGERIYD